MNFPRDELLALITQPLQHRCIGVWAQKFTLQSTWLTLALSIEESPRWVTLALWITTETGHWHWVQSRTQDHSSFVTSGGIAISKINASKELGHAGLLWRYWCYLWIIVFENCYLRPRYANTSSPWSFWCKRRHFLRWQRREQSAFGHFWRMILSA